MTDILTCPYRPQDRAACLALFDSNVPGFFAVEERNEFSTFLENLNDNPSYLVLLRGGVVIACGGVMPEPAPGRASLTWGMVGAALHGQGIGTALTTARLALARAMPGVTELTLATSQHTRGFYERFGFTLTRLTPGGFAPGLDRCDMVLRLDRA